MLRGEVGARALRVRSDVRGHGQVRLCKALGCGRCGCLKPIRACCVVGSAFFLVAPPRGGCAMAPRDSGMCWKQFMMCLEEIQFAAGVHSPPMHDPGLEEFQRPVRVNQRLRTSYSLCMELDARRIALNTYASRIRHPVLHAHSLHPAVRSTGVY